MAELIKLEKTPLPEIPKDWDFEEADKEFDELIWGWRRLTLDICEKLWIFYNKLPSPGTRTDLLTNVSRLPTWYEWLKGKAISHVTPLRRFRKLGWLPEPKDNIDITVYIQHDKWNIIYADPPWSYGNAGTRSSAHSQYPCLTLDEICKYRIKEKDNKLIRELIADNSLLFLWVTYPFLFEAKQVIEAWGFTYKTVGFVWVKTNQDDSLYMGMGNYTRANSEICLLGIHGKLPRQDASILNTHLTGRLEHSKKPHLFRSLIEQLYGELPRVEIFATERFPGWDAIGNNIVNGLFDGGQTA